MPPLPPGFFHPFAGLSGIWQILSWSSVTAGLTERMSTMGSPRVAVGTVELGTTAPARRAADWRIAVAVGRASLPTAPSPPTSPAALPPQWLMLGLAGQG